MLPDLYPFLLNYDSTITSAFTIKLSFDITSTVSSVNASKQ